MSRDAEAKEKLTATRCNGAPKLAPLDGDASCRPGLRLRFQSTMPREPDHDLGPLC